jgi:N-glycosylase/DNA lyase
MNPRHQSHKHAILFPVSNYDLEATLTSGQTFRWQKVNGAWEGVVGPRWVRLQTAPDGIRAQAAAPVTQWDWLADYLQVDLDLSAVLATFPDDPPMGAAQAACRGLRLLRQDPWECLACFVLSAAKQIPQIQQIVRLLCERFGSPVLAPPGHAPAFDFPAPARLARCSEEELRACKMGFRAPYLRAIAQGLANGQIDLNALSQMPIDLARAELLQLAGVGQKIANCVLLFACGFPTAFPVDVWVRKALSQLYFPQRKVSPGRLQHFAETHFGPWAGYAQQYLYHYMRTKQGSPPNPSTC